MTSSVFFVTLILYGLSFGAFADEWGYEGEHGPSDWKEDAPVCGQDHQSPIDIITKHVFPDSTISMLKFHGYEQNLTGGKFGNNGHTVTLSFPPAKTFKLSGGGMGANNYTGLQLHFHWSAPGSTKGSEHTVNGKHYPVEIGIGAELRAITEMHIVHIKDPYTSLGEVKDMDDGLTVLGVFLDVKEDAKDNPSYQKLFNSARNCTHEDDEAALNDGPSILSLLPGSASFYRYSGSLTTPPCYQTVTWTVFQEAVIISQAQLEILQSLKSSERDEKGEKNKSDLKSEKCADPGCHGKDKREADEEESDDEDEEGGDNLGGNFRPIQPLNGRVITSFLDIKIKEEDEHWTYHGSHDMSQWSHEYPVCNGDAQSPINILSIQAKTPGSDDDDASDNSPTTKSITYHGYDQPLSGSLKNNGHSVQLDLNEDLEYLLSDGGLEDSYKALQLHFHWGEVSSDGKLTNGAEHTLNDVRYPAELHVVHAKQSYIPSLSDFQKNSSDTYAVLGVFVDVYKDKSNIEPDSDDGFNPDMQKLIDSIEKVQYKDDSDDISSGPSLASLLPEVRSFYRYDGSLTTPPCSEAVIWTVFAKPITISMNQFIAFQRLFLVEQDDMLVRETINVLQMREVLMDTHSMKANEDGEITPKATADDEENNNNATFIGKLLDTITPFGGHDDKSGRESEKENAANVQYLLRNNFRNLQQLNQRTVYYYESPNATAVGVPTAEGSSTLAIVLWTLGGILVFIIMLAIVARCCCKKDKRKSTQYTAGSKTNDHIVNL